MNAPNEVSGAEVAGWSDEWFLRLLVRDITLFVPASLCLCGRGFSERKTPEVSPHAVQLATLIVPIVYRLAEHDERQATLELDKDKAWFLRPKLYVHTAEAHRR